MKRSILLGLATFFLAVFVYDAVLRPLLPGIRLPAVPGGRNLLTLILMLFSLFHAWYALGGRHSLLFFVLTALVSWAYEQLGVATGLIYGAYHYTNVLGPKLGHVPFLIPIAWFMMIYPSYVVANLMSGGWAAGSYGGLLRVLWLALLSAMVMTAWDLAIDPILSGPAVRAWIWEKGGAYFNIPVRNYLGWMLTTFTVYLAYRVYENRNPPRPVGPATVGIAAMPVIAYAAMAASNLLSNIPPALYVIIPFVMGIPVVAAAGRLLEQVRRA